MKYIISYDINFEKDKAAYSASHKRITDALEKMGAKKVQFSVWVLETVQSVQSVTAAFTSLLDRNDTILVAPTNDEMRLETGKRLDIDLSSLLVRPRTQTNSQTSGVPMRPRSPIIKPR